MFPTIVASLQEGASSCARIRRAIIYNRKRVV